MLSIENLLNRQYHRRDLLARGARTGTGILLIASGLSAALGAGGCRTDIVTRVRQFESEGETQALTFEKAKAYLPYIAELFVGNIDATKKPEDIARDAFIVQQDFVNFTEMQNGLKMALAGEDKDVLAHSVTKQLASDYPALDLTPSIARGILLDMSLGNAVAMIESGRIFIVLDRINKPDSVPTVDWQFQGLSAPVGCSPISPAVKLRSTGLHEMVHYSAPADMIPVTDTFRRAYKQVRGIDDGKDIEIEKKNFAVRVNRLPSTGFYELITDYLPALVSIKYGLPYTLGYGDIHRPHDIFNLNAVFEQGGIDAGEVYRMYKASQLETFMLRIAEGAQNVAFKNEEEKYAFSIRNFLMFTPIIWPNLRGAFPKIDPAFFQYVDPTTFKPVPPESFLWTNINTGETFYRETKLNCR